MDFTQWHLALLTRSPIYRANEPVKETHAYHILLSMGDRYVADTNEAREAILAALQHPLRIVLG